MRKIIQTMLKTVWSVKSTSTPNFVPVTGPINSTLVRGVRVAWELLGKTPNVEVQPAYRMSDDGITWSSTVTGLVGSYSSSTGWSYADASAVVNVDLKSFVQFGFLVRNTTGSAIEMAQASLRLTHADLSGQTFNAGPERCGRTGRPARSSTR